MHKTLKLYSKSLLSKNSTRYICSLISGYGLMGITIIIQFILVPLYIRYLGTFKYGIFIMIIAISNYAAIGMSWFNSGITRFQSEQAALKNREKFRLSYAFSKTVFTLYALVLVSIFWLVSPWLISDLLKDSEICFAIVLASICFLLNYEYSADRIAFFTRNLQIEGGLVESVGQIVFAIFACISLYLGFGLVGVIGSQLIGNLCTRLLATIYWKKDEYDLRSLWSFSQGAFLWKRFNKIGYSSALAGFFLLTLQNDVLLIGLAYGAEISTRLYLIWRIPEIFILLLSRIPTTHSPYLSELLITGQYKDLNSSYNKGLINFTKLTGIIAIIYGIAGPWILRAWVGESAPVEQSFYLITALAMFFIAVAKWPILAAHSFLNIRFLVRIQFLELTAKFLIFLFFWDTFSYLSISIANLIIYVFGVFYLYLKLGKKACVNTSPIF